MGSSNNKKYHTTCLTKTKIRHKREKTTKVMWLIITAPLACSVSASETWCTATEYPWAKSHPDPCNNGDCVKSKKTGRTSPCKGCSDGSDKCPIRGWKYKFCTKCTGGPATNANPEKWCVAAEYPWTKAMTDPCPNGDCRLVGPKRTSFSCKGCSDGSDKCVQAPWKYKFCFKCSAFSTTNAVKISTPAAKTAVVAKPAKYCAFHKKRGANGLKEACSSGCSGTHESDCSTWSKKGGWVLHVIYKELICHDCSVPFMA